MQLVDIRHSPTTALLPNLQKIYCPMMVIIIYGDSKSVRTREITIH
jgi:hypothetical protein